MSVRGSSASDAMDARSTGALRLKTPTRHCPHPETARYTDAAEAPILGASHLPDILPREDPFCSTFINDLAAVAGVPSCIGESVIDMLD